MIPKIIHYCWFGGNPLPEESKKYIDTWKKYCPEYEIKEWNENTFDVAEVPYTKEAYEEKTWAFVTDYVRLYALKNFGGIYMDTDVEVIKSLDVFLKDGGFSGFELPDKVPTGIMGSEKGHPFVTALLKQYDDRHFRVNGQMDLTTNVECITDYCVEHGLKLNNTKQTIQNFTMYPTDYFCPKNNRTYELKITDNTYTIHHFQGSWVPEKKRINSKIKKIFGPKLMKIILKVTDGIGITNRK